MGSKQFRAYRLEPDDGTRSYADSLLFKAILSGLGHTMIENSSIP